MCDEVWLETKIAEWRQRYAAGRLTFRTQHETYSFRLLREAQGKMSLQQARDFLRFVRSDLTSAGNVETGRFGPGLRGNNGNLMLARLDRFNYWGWVLATTGDVSATLEEFWTEKLPGAGILFPSAVLYLRDPSAYNYWSPQLERGLAGLMGPLHGPKRTPRDQVVRYLDYNEKVLKLRSRHAIFAEEVDILLDLAAQHTGPIPCATTEVVGRQNGGERLWLDSVSTVVSNTEEQAIEHLVHEASDEEFSTWLATADGTGSLTERQRLVRERQCVRSNSERLKRRYQYRCQICGWNSIEDHRVSVCEAHHIDPYSLSLNNSPSNLVVVCPNHHRLLHATNAQFDRVRLEFRGAGNQVFRLVLNEHL